MELPSVTTRWREITNMPQGYTLTEALFLRMLGLVYLAAFASFWPQMTGLLGLRGIVSISRLLPAVRSQLGSSAFYQIPTLFWLNCSNWALVCCCTIGCLAALLLIVGALSRIAA